MSEIRYTFTASGADSVVAATRSIGAAVKRTKIEFHEAARAAKELARLGSAHRSSDMRRYMSQVEASRTAMGRGTGYHSGKRAADFNRMVWAKENKEYEKHMNDRLRKEQAFERKRQSIVEKQARDRIELERRATATIARNRSQVFRAGGRALGYAGAAAMTSIAGAATGIVTKGARESVQLDDMVRMLAIRGSGSGERIDPVRLKREIENTARRNKGSKSFEIASALGGFVQRTGELGVGKTMQDVFAKFNVATGTSGEELGLAAADLFEKFGVKSPEEMNKALSILTVQGKKGAFELEDMARQFPRLAAAGAALGMQQGSEGVGRLGALAQIARKGSGTSAQAATSTENYLRDLAKKSDIIKREFGVDVFKPGTGKTQSRDVKDVTLELIAATKGDKSKLGKLLSMRAGRQTSYLSSIYGKELTEQMGAGATEAEANRAALEKITKAWEDLESSTNAVEQVNQDFADAQKMVSANLTEAWEELRGTVSEKLTPSIVSLIKKFSEIVKNTDAVDKLIGAFEVLAVAVDTAINALVGLGLIDMDKVKSRRAARTIEMSNDEILKIAGGDQKKANAIKEVAANRADREEAIRKGNITSSEAIAMGELEDKRAMRAAGITEEMVSKGSKPALAIIENQKLIDDIKKSKEESIRGMYGVNEMNEYERSTLGKVAKYANYAVAGPTGGIIGYEAGKRGGEGWTGFLSDLTKSLMGKNKEVDGALSGLIHAIGAASKRIQAVDFSGDKPPSVTPGLD